MAKVDLPRYVIAKRLADRTTAFYWQPPHWARGAVERNGQRCPVVATALPRDLGEACRIAAGLNEALDEWRNGTARKNGAGTVRWLFQWYQTTTKFKRLSAKTKADYRKLMAAISDHPMRRGTFGQRLASAVDAEAADKLYSLFQTRGERQATYAMQVCRLVWNWAVRYSNTTKVEVNPFAKMALNHRVSKGNWPAARNEYEAYRRAAANLGYHSMALAAALTFELVQRVSDVFGFEDPADPDGDGDAPPDERGIRWEDYQSKKSITVRQHKTKKRLVIPLVDDRYNPPVSLYPQLEKDLDRAFNPGASGLIVVEERNRKPYKPRRMSSVHREICEAAGLPKRLTFTSFRHGGATELGDAGETDIRSISGHTQIDTSLIYNKASQQKAREIALRRREYVRLISNTSEAGEDDD